MGLFRNWSLIGLYYEVFSPRMTSYGVRMFEGYICTKTGKRKIVEVDSYKTPYSHQYEYKVENLITLGYLPKERFLVDVANMNLKIKEIREIAK